MLLDESMFGERERDEARDQEILLVNTIAEGGYVSILEALGEHKFSEIFKKNVFESSGVYDEDGFTPILMAATNGHAAMIR